MKRKYMTIVTMLSAISLAACGQTTTTSVSNSTANAQTENSTATDEKPSSDDDASGVNADTDQDRVADKDNNDEEDATSGEETTITVQDGSIKTKGDGVEVDGSTITITEAGTYRFSGTIEDGKIVIDAKKKEVVVIFDDFMITNDEESPVQCLAAKTFTVKLASGSENTVTDGRAAIAEEDTNQSDDTESSSDTDETEEDVPDAAIYSKADLVITGKGSLTVNGGYCDGIHSKDTLIIESGTLKVTATEHGINGKDSLTINGGSIIVYGPENSGNSAIDYNGTGVITGGEILTTGMSGRMADTFSEGSTQSYIVYYTTSTEDAGTSIEIVDADGNTIYEDDGTEKKFNMVIYSSDDLKTGNTYTVKVGDSSESVEISDIENTIGTASQDTMGGGMRNHFN
ncbi:MAG: carbohydrate-binding domain-containing protein [Oribacterium sp.]|nr:carbohydrate-binding domain-containing protein [Oribacterium sp.]